MLSLQTYLRQKCYIYILIFNNMHSANLCAIWGPDLFLLNRLMTIEQRFTTVPFIHNLNLINARLNCSWSVRDKISRTTVNSKYPPYNCSTVNHSSLGYKQSLLSTVDTPINIIIFVNGPMFYITVLQYLNRCIDFPSSARTISAVSI